MISSVLRVDGRMRRSLSSSSCSRFTSSLNCGSVRCAARPCWIFVSSSLILASAPRMLSSMSPMNMYCVTPTMATARTSPTTRATQAGFPSSVSAIPLLLLLHRARGRGRGLVRAARPRGAARRRRPRGSRRLPLRRVREVERHVEAIHRRDVAQLRDRAEGRLLEQRIVLDVVDEVRDGVGIETAAADADQAPAHGHAVEPHQVGKILADAVHDLHRPALVLLELVDQIDALLQRFLALGVVVDLLDDDLQAVGLGLLARHRVAALLQLAVLVPPPAARDQNAEEEAGDDENVVEVAGAGGDRRSGGGGRGAAAAYRPPLPHQVDFYQASPNFLMARPTAMAMLGPISARSSGLNSFSSTLIFWNGFMIATGMPNLSRRMASRFSTPEPPPARTISSTRSAPDVAVKKSRVLRSSPAKSSETELRMGMTCWIVLSPTGWPFFSSSACSNERLSSRWMASVYWFPPNVMSRQNSDVPPERTFTFVTDAPTFTSASTLPSSSE